MINQFDEISDVICCVRTLLNTIDIHQIERCMAVGVDLKSDI